MCVILALCACLVWFATAGSYYMREGMALFGLWFSARANADLLADPSLPQDERAFLEEVDRIRAFAREQLGLADTPAYTTMIRLDRGAVASVVSACADDRFEQYLWDYPVLGPMPYKGFFDPDDAKAEAKRLKDHDLDVMVRGVGAFSTLGILPDPLFSYMKDDKAHELAELLIHELTHGTVFVSGKGDFNENLAYFVGKEGARQYLAQRYGANSPELHAMDANDADEATFLGLVHGLYLDLDKVYRNTGLSRAQKLSIKSAVIEGFRKDFIARYNTRFKGESWRGFSQWPLNNAIIMTWRNYTARQDSFGEAFEQQGRSIPALLAWIKAGIASGRSVPGMKDVPAESSLP